MPSIKHSFGTVVQQSRKTPSIVGQQSPSRPSALQLALSKHWGSTGTLGLQQSSVLQNKRWKINRQCEHDARLFNMAPVGTERYLSESERNQNGYAASYFFQRGGLRKPAGGHQHNISTHQLAIVGQHCPVRFKAAQAGASWQSDMAI